MNTAGAPHVHACKIIQLLSSHLAIHSLGMFGKRAQIEKICKNKAARVNAGATSLHDQRVHVHPRTQRSKLCQPNAPKTRVCSFQGFSMLRKRSINTYIYIYIIYPLLTSKKHQMNKCQNCWTTKSSRVFPRFPLPRSPKNSNHHHQRSFFFAKKKQFEAPPGFPLPPAPSRWRSVLSRGPAFFRSSWVTRCSSTTFWNSWFSCLFSVAFCSPAKSLTFKKLKS